MSLTFSVPADPWGPTAWSPPSETAASDVRTAPVETTARGATRSPWPGARSWPLLPQPSDALDKTRPLAQHADRRSTSKHADYRSRARASIHLEAGMLSSLSSSGRARANGGTAGLTKPGVCRRRHRRGSDFCSASSNPRSRSHGAIPAEATLQKRSARQRAAEDARSTTRWWEKMKQSSAGGSAAAGGVGHGGRCSGLGGRSHA